MPRIIVVAASVPAEWLVDLDVIPWVCLTFILYNTIQLLLH